MRSVLGVSPDANKPAYFNLPRRAATICVSLTISRRRFLYLCIAALLLSCAQLAALQPEDLTTTTTILAHPHRAHAWVTTVVFGALLPIAITTFRVFRGIYKKITHVVLITIALSLVHFSVYLIWDADIWKEHWHSGVHAWLGAAAAVTFTFVYALIFLRSPLTCLVCAPLPPERASAQAGGLPPWLTQLGLVAVVLG